MKDTSMLGPRKSERTHLDALFLLPGFGLPESTIALRMLFRCTQVDNCALKSLLVIRPSNTLRVQGVLQTLISLVELG
jgi:hypothetical protein